MSEQVDATMEKFQAMTTDERRRFLLSTSLTLMGLRALQVQLEQITEDRLSAIGRPADSGDLARNTISQFVVSHTGKLADNLTRVLDAMAKHNPADSDFVSRLLIAVFDLDVEMREGEDRVEDESTAESAASPVGQSDGEAATAGETASTDK